MYKVNLEHLLASESKERKTDKTKQNHPHSQLKELPRPKLEQAEWQTTGLEKYKNT